MPKKLIIISLFTALFIFCPTYAATSATDTNAPSPSPDFPTAGLGDDDLSVDLEAEALPTTDFFAYRWERLKNSVISVFTLNAERKTDQYNSRLHQLDRKLAACAEIGDRECAQKIEQHKLKLEAKTAKYLAKREELKEQFYAKYLDWRTKRETISEKLHQRAADREDHQPELVEQRQQRREDAKARRRQHLENLRDRQEQHQEEVQNKIEAREQLIEARSSSLKNRLDDTREQVELHNQNLEQEAD